MGAETAQDSQRQEQILHLQVFSKEEIRKGSISRNISLRQPLEFIIITQCNVIQTPTLVAETQGH